MTFYWPTTVLLKLNNFPDVALRGVLKLLQLKKSPVRHLFCVTIVGGRDRTPTGRFDWLAELLLRAPSKSTTRRHFALYVPGYARAIYL
jgi:hypothetical protein